MTVKLLTEQLSEFLSLIGGCIGASESIHVKIPHCWKSHVSAHLCKYYQRCKEFCCFKECQYEEFSLYLFSVPQAA